MYVSVFHPHVGNTANAKKQSLCTVFAIDGRMKSLMGTMFPPVLSIVYGREIHGHVVAPVVTANSIYMDSGVHITIDIDDRIYSLIG